MRNNYSHHAEVRAQQRGIPPQIHDWLLDYGQEKYDGRGGVVRYFNQRSVRKMERDFGRAPVRQLNHFLSCFLVESSHDGTVITVGRRHTGARVRNR